MTLKLSLDSLRAGAHLLWIGVAFCTIFSRVLIIRSLVSYLLKHLGTFHLEWRRGDCQLANMLQIQSVNDLAIVTGERKGGGFKMSSGVILLRSTLAAMESGERKGGGFTLIPLQLELIEAESLQKTFLMPPSMP